MSRIAIAKVMRFESAANQGALEFLGFYNIPLETMTLIESHGLPGEIKTREVEYVDILKRRFVVCRGQLTLPHKMRFPVSKFKSVPKGSAELALTQIKWARDHHAKHGEYPWGTVGKDQCFDDWAADLAEKALRKD